MPDLSAFLPCPERFKRKGPHELAGPCPACGGRDRFLVWPDRPRGGAYLCRQCGARGDGIQFLRDFCRLSYADACRTLGLASGEGRQGTTGRGRRSARKTSRPSWSIEARHWSVTGGSWCRAGPCSGSRAQKAASAW